MIFLFAPEFSVIKLVKILQRISYWNNYNERQEEQDFGIVRLVNVMPLWFVLGVFVTVLKYFNTHFWFSN